MKIDRPRKTEMRIEIDWVPQTWYGRLVAAVVGVLLLWFGIMFFSVFLFVIGLALVVAIAFVALAFVKTAKGWSSSVIDAEYYVEEKDMAEPSDKQKISEMGLKQK